MFYFYCKEINYRFGVEIQTEIIIYKYLAKQFPVAIGYRYRVFMHLFVKHADEIKRRKFEFQT